MKITSLKDNGQELKESLGNYAPLKARIYAFLLDYLLIIVYGIFVVGTISFVFRLVIVPLFSGSPITAQLTGFLLITLPASLYFILCERSGWRGTWGKRRLGTRVVTDAGANIGPVRATLRTVIKFCPGKLHTLVYGVLSFLVTFPKLQ